MTRLKGLALGTALVCLAGGAPAATTDFVGHLTAEALRAEASGGLSQQLHERLNAAGELTVDGLALDAASLRALYRSTGHRPLWVAADGSLDRAEAGLAALSAAWDEGLDPADYHTDAIAARLAGDDPVALELLLSAAMLDYARHVGTGRLEPRDLGALVAYERRPSDAVLLTRLVAASGDVAAAARALAPRHEDYQRLRQALAAYRALAEQGGWPSLPEGETLDPGERSALVPALRARLAATGDHLDRSGLVLLRFDGTVSAPTAEGADATRSAVQAIPVADGSAGGADATLYDEALVESVKRFQARHGLEADGVVGPRTRAALNADVEQRIGDIAAAMETWRWLPDRFDGRHILVNVPAYGLEVIEDGRLVRAMDVIVGKPDRATPLFSSDMAWLEFNPTWTVPETIANEDMLPALRRNPGTLANRNIRLFADWSGRHEVSPWAVDWWSADIDRYMLRQEPGPNNALGKVKFMMDNPFSVYLHDTPSRELFGRAERALSSGCVRVADPLWLADYLLQGAEDWDEARRAAVLDGWRTTRIDLAAPVPVHLTYQTAWVNDDGMVQFRDDIYGLSARIAEALDLPPAGPMTVAAAG